MISLSATSYDPSGNVILWTRMDNPYQGRRRGSVTATLDGGSSAYDGGYSISDQTLTASLSRPSRDLLLALQYLVAYYSQLIVCCESGAFIAVPSFSLSKGTLSVSFRLLTRIDS